MEGWQSGNAAPWKGVVGNDAGVRFPHLPPYKLYYWLNSLKFRNNIFVFVPLIGLMSIPPLL